MLVRGRVSGSRVPKVVRVRRLGAVWFLLAASATNPVAPWTTLITYKVTPADLLAGLLLQ